MLSIDPSSIPKSSWIRHHQFWRPESIDTICPFCKMMANFKLDDPVFDEKRKTISSTGKCPRCQEKISCWVIEPGSYSDPNQKTCKCLAIYPHPVLKRDQINGSDKIPEPRIKRAYLDALKVYNEGVWTATATCCRRTLEGIIQRFIPEEDRKGTLGSQLKKLSENKAEDLIKPLISLSDGIREGGNLGAHFDLDKEPDQKTASLILDLIEYLLEYIFILPALVDELKNQIENLNKDEGIIT